MNQPTAQFMLRALDRFAGEWTLRREGAPFAQRFTGTFGEDGRTITGRWELAEDGKTWQTDFDVIYTRVT